MSHGDIALERGCSVVVSCCPHFELQLHVACVGASNLTCYVHEVWCHHFHCVSMGVLSLLPLHGAPLCPLVCPPCIRLTCVLGSRVHGMVSQGRACGVARRTLNHATATTGGDEGFLSRGKGREVDPHHPPLGQDWGGGQRVLPQKNV